VAAAIAHGPPPWEDEDRIGFLGVFASAAVESAFREQRFRDDRWLIRFLVIAGMLRVSLLLAADYQHFGLGEAFWLLGAGRLLFLLLSAGTLLTLPRLTCAAATDRLLLGWGLLLLGMTIYALSSRPPSNNGLLLMSFGVIVVTYCITPLSLSRQATLTLMYSAALLYACRHTDAGTLIMVGSTHAMAHVFGAITSWRNNHRRRKVYLGVLHEAELRVHLEAAVAEIRTLRGLVCICAWCKRIRAEADAWESVEKYVQSRTHASFSHGICPECYQGQVAQFASSRGEPALGLTQSV
jgi:hypothetical protein